MASGWNEWTPAKAKWIGGFSLVVAILWIVLPGSPPPTTLKSSANSGHAKQDRIAKAENWNGAAILENLAVCREADDVVKYALDNEGQHAAYQAAVRAKNECFRAMQEAPPGPTECRKVAMMGVGYYDRLSTAIDTVDLKPSTVEQVESGRRAVFRATSDCVTALERGPKALQKS